MKYTDDVLVKSDSPTDFADIFNSSANMAGERAQGKRLNLEQDSVKNGLGRLVLTLIKLLHELLERQAIRRMESRSLSESEIENLGMTLMLQAQEIDRLRREFGLEEEELNLDLGPLGKLL